MNTQTVRLGYAPRNALNADELKAGIAARSRTRGDGDDIRAWLLNHFYRHVVANFVPARVIESLDDARRALAPAPVPTWVVARFGDDADARDERPRAARAPVVWVDPADPSLLVLETRIVEFLESRVGTSLAGKLDRINCPQALALWEQEHARIAARVERGWRESRPEAVRSLLARPEGRFVEFLHDSPLLRAEMAYESYAMRHCLGQFEDRRALDGGYGERYAQAIEAGRMRLISFRDAGGQPHVTISAIVHADGPLEIEQVKGKQNRPPVARYVNDVVACLNVLGTNEAMPADCIEIGIVRTQAGWMHIDDVQDTAAQASLVARHPTLYSHLRAPTPAVEWFVAARRPQLLNAHAPHAAAVRYATRSLDGASPNDSGSFVTEGIEWPGFDAAGGDRIDAPRRIT
ncbi:hypothetical protein NTJ56_36440 [Burkholderia contaminans]|uniref:hypothetical protein n=1 Tax=Burkholderia contaminans TaxID=488447 RepID=UPI001CF4431E|nr:hypothetical protein [Burkholderia contaminans]MCA7915387.1 hypothetical protein [Burkholderia contaminans]UUX42061.1 hypothetical protein NTJ56_36440 [Burkholderia contaminans]